MNVNRSGENMEINKSFFDEDHEHRRSYDFGTKKQNQINMLIHDLDLLAIDHIAKNYEISRNTVLDEFIQAALQDIALYDNDLVSENDARYLLASKVDEILGTSGNTSGSWDADLFFTNGPRNQYFEKFHPTRKEVYTSEGIYYEKITSNQYDILEKKLKQIGKKG